MRPAKKEQASNPPKDIFSLFLDKEVRRAWRQEGSLKERAEIILDYDQATLQALSIHQPCHQCSVHIDGAKIRQDAQNVLPQFLAYRQRMQDETQQRPTREEWRTLLHAYMSQLDELTRLCPVCKSLFQRAIMAQFHHVRIDQRKGAKT